MGKKIAGGLAALLILAWAGIFLVYMPSLLTQTIRLPITETPESVGLDFDEVSIPSPVAGVNLSAWWMPADEAKGTLLFIHGANANKQDFYFGVLPFAKRMTDAGFNVMSLDLRNHGASDEADGGRIGMGLTEHRDIPAAIDMINRLAPGLPIYGAGVSMGGATLIHAAKIEPRLQRLILVDPLLDVDSATLAGMVAMTGLPDWLLVPTLISARSVFALADGPRPLDVAATLSLPVLIIQDPEDPVTQARFAHELAALNPNLDLHLVPPAPAGHPYMADAGPWGSHAAANQLFPDEVTAEFLRFLAATP